MGDATAAQNSPRKEEAELRRRRQIHRLREKADKERHGNRNDWTVELRLPGEGGIRAGTQRRHQRRQAADSARQAAVLKRAEPLPERELDDAAAELAE